MWNIALIKKICVFFCFDVVVVIVVEVVVVVNEKAFEAPK